MNTPQELQHLLCEQWCADLEVGEDDAGWRLSLPLSESDGDAVTVWIKAAIGGWRLRDCGSTMMRLSYGMDVDLLLEGSRLKVLNQLLNESQLTLEDGELTAFAPESGLGAALMSFGQALIRIGDIKLWSKNRVTSTFYEDLKVSLCEIVGAENLLYDYAPKNIPSADDYRVDYAVMTASRPLYIFGVLNTDKAKLTTIILQHLRQHGHLFDSLVVPSDIDQIQRSDLRRLLNAANDFVDSSRSTEALEQKINQRLKA